MELYEIMVTVFNSYYDIAKENTMVRKPLTYALYKTWIVIDKLEKPRKEDSK